jgi:hypothetical protein
MYRPDKGQEPSISLFLLLKIQGKSYNIHKEWSGKFSPETVRAAILECRNNRVVKTGHFIELMQAAKDRLDHKSESGNYF